MGEQKCSPVAPKRTVTNLSDNTTSEETYSYDAAGNITSCTVSDGTNTFVYDQNNRLTSYNGQAVTYDMDGNMLSATLNGTQMSFVYDSANRLISAGQNSYTYNVENVRVRNLCGESETTYAYNTNGRLSQLLVKTTDGVITKYVYGIGLIGEETSGSFKTYHFDYRGSTTAITDINGNVTDTFEYDTYGNLISRTGTSAVIFLYNGRDGVVTDENGLIYMRARYYSPELRRFINTDIIAGEISNAVTLNRYAYANGNPVSNIDPFGFSAERGNPSRTDYINSYMKKTNNVLYKLLQSWGFSLTKTAYETSEYINILWGGFTVKLYVDISFETPLDTNITSNISFDSKYAIHEATTPELKLPWGDIGAKIGAYTDKDRLSVGVSAYLRNSGWTYGTKHQIGLYSEASITSISYKPEDKYLPTVSISLDSEMNHLVKVAAATIAVASIYAPQAVIAAAPTAVEFIQQLGNMTPKFA